MTAVEWLEEIISKMEAYGGDLPPLMIHIKQAKEMEKKQIIDAYNDGNYAYGMGIKEPEQYYKEIFKNK
jgi:hypothetical protein